MNNGTGESELGRGLAGRPLFSRLIGRVGFDRLATSGRLPGECNQLVWYAITVVVFEMVVLQVYNLATGRPIVFVKNPLWLLRPLILIGAAVATRSLHRRYDRAVERSNLRKRTSDPTQFDGLVPDWLFLIVVAVGIGFTLLNAFVFLTIPQIDAAGGIARVVRFVVVTPLGYVPVLATFLSTYLAIEVFVPRRLSRSDIGLDYLDPENLGGMRPIGELVKFAYYFLMLGLVAYAIATYGPYILEGIFAYAALDPPGRVVNLAFTAVWAAAVGTMAYGVVGLHWFMTREKRETLHQLDTRAREQIDQPWDIECFDVGNPPEGYQAYREQVNYVTSTKEYPATFTMWTQLLIGVMIPKVIQIVLVAV